MRQIRHISRIIVLAFDLIICFLALVGTFLLRYEFSIPSDVWGGIMRTSIMVILPIQAAGLVLFRTYAGFVRFSVARDYERIIFATTSSLLATFVAFSLIFHGLRAFSYTILFMDYAFATFAMVAGRILVRVLFARAASLSSQEIAVVFGSEQEALGVKRLLDDDYSSGTRVVALFCPDRKHRGTKIEGVPVYPMHHLIAVLRRKNVDKFIIAEEIKDAALRDRIIDTCLQESVSVITAPSLSAWLDGRVNFRNVKPMDVNDLLGREAIVLSKENIQAYVDDKVVLVTGAAGSIGSEIVRQLAKFNPKRVLLFDQSETPLYEIDLELKEMLCFARYEVLIGSAADAHRLRKIFETYRPQVVFHAAAYKHVPMMENHPYEAVYNNVSSTKILADLSDEYAVDRFVMVSTDKAVNPTNVMGASKRICELYVQARSKHSKTKFITTRFGNVLGSNGSVVLRFQKQIAAGGPVTITHRKITRYFMTIPEACQLVLEAGTMGQGSDIFVFDMGEPELIIELARKMIRLQGLVPDKDIKIVEVGLRPGEKLYEEVLATSENTTNTHHPKIRRAKVRDCDFEEVSMQIEELLSAIYQVDDFEVVRRMKVLVPEFISMNSRFEVLDSTEGGWDGESS